MSTCTLYTSIVLHWSALNMCAHWTWCTAVIWYSHRQFGWDAGSLAQGGGGTSTADQKGGQAAKPGLEAAKGSNLGGET